MLLMLLLRLLVVALEKVFLEHAGARRIASNKKTLVFRYRVYSRSNDSSGSSRGCRGRSVPVLTPAAGGISAIGGVLRDSSESQKVVAGLIGAALVRPPASWGARARFDVTRADAISLVVAAAAAAAAAHVQLSFVVSGACSVMLCVVTVVQLQPPTAQRVNTDPSTRRVGCEGDRNHLCPACEPSPGVAGRQPSGGGGSD
jgi:hypothetical protein